MSEFLRKASVRLHRFLCGVTACCKFLKRAMLTTIAMLVWIVVTVAVAIPGKWTTLDIQAASNIFISDNHFIYFSILILADVFISVAVLNDIHLKKRMCSRYSVGFIAFSMVITLVVSAMKGSENDDKFLTSHQFEVFIFLMLLYATIRFIMYWIEDSEGNQGSEGGVLPVVKSGVAATTVQPKFTAVPVGLVNRGNDG